MSEEFPNINTNINIQTSTPTITPNHHKSKTLTLRLLDPNSESDIAKEVERYFSDADLFLKPDKNFVVNKKINFVDFKDTRKSVLSPKMLYSIKRTTIKPTNRSSLNSTEIKENCGYEEVSKAYLQNMFERFKPKNRRDCNTLDYSGEIDEQRVSQKIPKELKISLSCQSNNLLRKSQEDRRSAKMIKYISKITKKKPKDILMNNVDIFRLKKQILFNLPTTLTRENETASKNKWTLSLRRPENFIGSRDAWVNVNSEENPIWTRITEKSPIIANVSIQPGFNSKNKDFKEFISNPLLNSTKNKGNVNKVRNMEDLNVKGVKLFDLEYKNAMSGGRRKMIKNYFSDKGKIILGKDVNDLFGYETISKNYDKKNFSRRMLSSEF